MPVVAGAMCARHPAVAAVEICARCGAFVCPSCLELRENAVLCTACHERYAGKASGRAIASLVLGIIGINCGLLPGLIGLVLAYQELAAIERGESPEAGRSIAVGGKIIGFINLGLLVLAVGIAAAMILWAMRLGHS